MASFSLHINTTMEKKKLVLWMMLMPFVINIIVGVGKADEEEPNNKFSQLGKFLNKAHTYLYPPKIDFRPGKGVEDGGENGNGNVNVKEAITKSFEKTKEIVEDSAKAAAEKLQQKTISNSEL